MSSLFPRFQELPMAVRTVLSSTGDHETGSRCVLQGRRVTLEHWGSQREERLSVTLTDDEITNATHESDRIVILGHDVERFVWENGCLVSQERKDAEPVELPLSILRVLEAKVPIGPRSLP